jgi:DNA polymerase
MMYKIPYAEFAEHKKRTGQHHPLRAKGKIGELAFGYQGWVGAAKAFDMPGTDDEIKADILAWRAASPAVEWLWGGQTVGKASGVINNATAATYKGAVDDRLLFLKSDDPQARWDRTEFLFGVEGKAVQALQTPDQWFDVARLDGTATGIEFMYDGKAQVLYCRLPSGRVLTYRNPRLQRTDRGEWGISYEGYNTNPKNGPRGWITIDTWGGRLVENIIQAVCRDVLRACCIALELAGYPVVLHTYDEPVSEVPIGFGSVEEYERVCTEEVIKRCQWAADWPIRAPGGYRAKRYRKG